MSRQLPTLDRETTEPTFSLPRVFSLPYLDAVSLRQPPPPSPQLFDPFSPLCPAGLRLFATSSFPSAAFVALRDSRHFAYPSPSPGCLHTPADSHVPSPSAIAPLGLAAIFPSVDTYFCVYTAIDESLSSFSYFVGFSFCMVYCGSGKPGGPVHSWNLAKSSGKIFQTSWDLVDHREFLFVSYFVRK